MMIKFVLIFLLPSLVVADVYSVNMPLSNFRLTSSYGYRTHPIKKSVRHHDGLDLAAPKGTPIHAVLDGQVAFTGTFGNYGKLIVLAHSGFKTTHYAHCDSVKFKVGDVVKKGDVIATVGDTGSVTGAHLHFEIRQNGEALDPMDFINE